MLPTSLRRLPSRLPDSRPPFEPLRDSYLSIPQAGSETTHLAIQSLASYSSLASEFVIVAPALQHAETEITCDFATYRRRTWCRAEQLCHLFRNGLDAMWLATSETEVQRLSSTAASRTSTPLLVRKMGTNATAAEDVDDDWKRMSEGDWLAESIRVFQGDGERRASRLGPLGLPLPLALTACPHVADRRVRAPFLLLSPIPSPLLLSFPSPHPSYRIQ